MNTNEPRAYPPERSNGDKPKRKAGRPKGIPNPNGGRKKADPNKMQFPRPSTSEEARIDLRKGDGGAMVSKLNGGKKGPVLSLAIDQSQDLLPLEEWEMYKPILDGLDANEVQFVVEYMVDMNARASAIRLGFSNASAGNAGCIILNRPHVRKAVDILLELRARNQALVANRLLIGLDELAHFDKADLLAEDGDFLPINEWPVAARQALTGLDVEELWEGRGKDKIQIGVIKKARFVDPIRARELLGRHMRLWGEPQINVNQTNINAQNVQINQRIDLADFTAEELQVALKLGLKLNGNAVDLSPGLSGEEISESAIIGT